MANLTVVMFTNVWPPIIIFYTVVMYTYLFTAISTDHLHLISNANLLCSPRGFSLHNRVQLHMLYTKLWYLLSAKALKNAVNSKEVNIMQRMADIQQNTILRQPLRKYVILESKKVAK